MLSIPLSYCQDRLLKSKDEDLLQVIGKIRTKRKSIPGFERMEVLTMIVTQCAARAA